MTQPVSFRRYWPLLTILLLALVLRLINIDSRSLWYDEAYTALFAASGIDNIIQGTITPVEGGAADIHPQGHLIMLNLWMAVFGQSPLAVRSLSVLMGLITILLMYGIGKALFDQRMGLAAAFLTAIMPFHVQYSQEVRMYSLLAMALMLATYLFIRAWQYQSRDGEPLLSRLRWWLAFGAAAALAMYAQQLAAFYLAALGLIPLMARRRDAIMGMSVAVFLAVLLYLPWLVNVPSQFEKINAYFWIERPSLPRVFLSFRSFLTFAADLPSPAGFLALAGACVVVIFLFIQIYFYIRKPRRQSTSDAASIGFIMWLFLMPIAAIWLVSQVVQPLYLDRGLIGSALMLYLGLAWLLLRGGLPRPIAGLIGLLILALVSTGLYYHHTWDTFPNSPFRAAATQIAADWQVGDVVIHADKQTAMPMIYYDRDLLQRYLADAPGSSQDTLSLPTQEAMGLIADLCLAMAARDAERIWWVTFERAEEQYALAELPLYDDYFAWLNQFFEPGEIRRFNDLNVYLYESRQLSYEIDCDASAAS